MERGRRNVVGCEGEGKFPQSGIFITAVLYIYFYWYYNIYSGNQTAIKNAPKWYICSTIRNNNT